MSAYRINAKEKEDTMDPNDVMSSQSFSLKITRYIIGTILAISLMCFMSCSYSNYMAEHPSPAKIELQKSEAESNKSAAAKEMFEHMNK